MNANVNILSYSQGHIDTFIVVQPASFFFTDFYGNPDHNLRVSSWNLLNKIATTHNNSELGWIIGGDFNEILYDSEKCGGIPRASHLINNFRSTLSLNKLSSLNSTGPRFTWTNNIKHCENIVARLDRFVADDTWRLNFSNFKATNLDFYSSDHRAIYINTSPSPILFNHSPVLQKSFFFEHKWILEDEYASLIRDSWKNLSSGANLDLKLLSLANNLKSWRRMAYVPFRPR